MSDDPDLELVLEDAMPRCPSCLIPLDDEGPVELPYLECPSCGQMFL